MNNEKVFEIHAELTIRLTGQDVDDIVGTALDSVTYWADEAKVVGDYLGEYASDQISRGGALLIHDFEDDRTEKLDIERFTQGFRIWLEKGYDRYAAVQGREVDTCNIDGEMADGIIQCALFGDIIYG